MPYTGSKSQSGRGSTLSIGSTPTEIGECNDVPFTRPEWTDVDVTNFDSAADAEILPVIREPKEFTVKGNRVSSDAGQVACETAYQAATLSAFTLVLPKTTAQTTSGDKYTFNAFVKNLSFDLTPKKQVEFNLLLKISGAVTFTVGS